MLGIKKMPQGVNYLHWINGFSTFSYAVMFSSLALYLSKELGFSQHTSNATVGLFLALNFTLHVFAGYLGDRFLSHRTMLLISSVCQFVGVIILSFCSINLIYISLAFVLVGCGIGSTNLNCLLTQRFSENDKRRDAAFMINYWAVNVGFFIGFFAGGYFDIKGSYRDVFLLSSIFNVLTVFLVALSWKRLSFKREVSQVSDLKKTNRHIGFFSLILIVPVVVIAFYYSSISSYLIMMVGFIVLSGIFISALKIKNHKERDNIYTFLILTVSSIVFWTLFYVGPIGLVHFLENNVNSKFYGYTLPTQWMMELNSVFVIILSPVLVLLLYKFQAVGYNVSISKKFITALVCIAGSFFILSLGIYFSNALGQVSSIWVVLHYFFQAVGELLLAPVGNAMIGELAPKRLQGIMMGAWMMVSGMSAVIAHYFSNMMTNSENLDPIISNHDFYNTFNKLGLYTLITACLLVVFTSKFNSLINNKKAAVREHEGAV